MLKKKEKKKKENTEYTTKTTFCWPRGWSFYVETPLFTVHVVIFTPFTKYL